MNDKIREYEGERIRVRYSVTRCIHAAECVRTLPAVFDPKRRPWIDPDGSAADQVAAAVRQCPTGALHFQRTDEGEAETPPDRNEVTVAPDGPLYVRGDVRVITPDGSEIVRDTRIALCRCGASRHKPLCDGRHVEVAFHDEGRLPEQGLSPDLESTADTLTFTVAPNGPLLFKGHAVFRDASGAARGFAGKGALCRCGASRRKPFCDGSHKQVAFDGS